LPHTCDLFEEARFFIQLLASLRPCDSNLAAANWCVGAHVGAFIGIDDAARHDFENLGRQNVLHEEFFLKSNDISPMLRDPVAVNRLFRDLRNIRDHFGQGLVELRTTMQLPDIAKKKLVGSPRWYLKPFDALRLDRLQKPRVSEFELRKFLEFYMRTTLLQLLCQNMVVMASAIQREVSAPRN